MDQNFQEQSPSELDPCKVYVCSPNLEHISGNALEQMLKKFVPDMQCTSLLKKKERAYAFVFFENPGNADAFIREMESVPRIVDGVLGEVVPLKVSIGVMRKCGTVAKRIADDEKSQERSAKKRQLAESQDPTELPKLIELKLKHKKVDRLAPGCIASRITPLAGFSYADQLMMKHQYTRTCVRRITRGVYHHACDTGTAVPEWSCPKAAKGFRGCPVEPPSGCPSEARTGYRNKCEFAIGFSDAEFSVPEIGYVLVVQNFEPMVRSSSGCLHTPCAMQELCCRMKHLVALSDIPIYSRRNRTGVWRAVQVRLDEPSRKMMVSVQLHASVTPRQERLIRFLLLRGLVGISEGEELQRVTNSEFNDSSASLETFESHFESIRVEYPSIATHPRRGPDGLFRYDDMSVVSLYTQRRSEPSDTFDADPFEFLWGEAHIEMSILGLKFTISPLTFFQTNRIACEMLYQKAIDWLSVSPNTVVLDICCGAGTMSLCFARHLPKGHVVGIEIVPDAIENAKQSCKANNLDSNVEFHCGKAEALLSSVLKNLEETNKKDVEFCAVVDPPRAGLHPNVIQALRSCLRIAKVVFVSCNPESLVENAIGLCSTSDRAPFYPSRATTIDMFPHTYHCEILMEFCRVAADERQHFVCPHESEMCESLCDPVS